MLKQLFVIIALLIGGILCAEDLINFGNRLEEFRLNPAASGTIQRKNIENGMEVLDINWKSGKKTETLTVSSLPILLSEFESATFQLQIFVPANSAAKRIAMNISGYGKKPIVLKANIKKTEKDSVQTLLFECTQTVEYSAQISSIQVLFDKQNGASSNVGLKSLAIQYSGLLHTLDTGNSVNVLDLSHRQSAGLRFENKTSKERIFSLEYQIADSFGAVHDYGKADLKIPAGSKFAQTFRDHSESGVYHVQYKIIENGKTRNYSRRYAAMIPAGKNKEKKASGFLFSICSHSIRFRVPEIRKELELMELCGANHTRNGFTWPQIQPQRNLWCWDRADFLVEETRKRNMEFQTIFMWAPSWAIAKDWKNIHKKGLPRPDYDAYGDYVSSVVKRYKGKIRFYEVWNEPDIPYFANFSFQEYTQLQKIAFKEVKKVDPEALLLAGGFANSNSIPLQNYVFSHAPDTCDVIGYHGHGTFETFTGPLDHLLKLWKEKNVRQPWFANETAISSISAGENGQAVTLFKKLFYSWSKNSIGYTWYDLRNDGYDPKNAEHNFGMVTGDFYPKPVYVVFNAIARLYRDAEFVSEEKFRNDCFAFRFRKKGETLFPLWNEFKDQDSQILFFETDAENAEFIDMFGNVSSPLLKKSGDKNILVVEVKNNPGTIRLNKSSAEMKYIGSLITPVNKIYAEAGKEREIKFQIWNPFQTAQTATLKIKTPDGIICSDAEQIKRVAPGEKALVQFHLSASSGFVSAISELKSLTCDLQFKGTKTSYSISFPLQSFLRLSGKSTEWQRLAVANRADLVTSLVAAEPSNSHLFWQGRADLSIMVSARILQNKYLQFIVPVIDDIHNQPYSGYDLFKGDSLQLMIQFPGQNNSWEIGASVQNDGKDDKYIWNAPGMFDKEKITSLIRVAHSRDKKNVLFITILLPLKEMGTSVEELKKGFRFNIMANDNDGPCRESYISLIRGNPKNVENFLIVIVE